MFLPYFTKLCYEKKWNEKKRNEKGKRHGTILSKGTFFGTEWIGEQGGGKEKDTHNAHDSSWMDGRPEVKETKISIVDIYIEQSGAIKVMLRLG